mmetsp:Transcript_50822/g.122530  ORF Transcript_50822/g.122530 Transcript_50822/m.122530 type:complete len:81 (+) Transcript_50822:423-665(+)
MAYHQNGRTTLRIMQKKSRIEDTDCPVFINYVLQVESFYCVLLLHLSFLIAKSINIRPVLFLKKFQRDGLICSFIEIVEN